MAFSIQAPGSANFNRFEFNSDESPSVGGNFKRSCYSYVEKVSCRTNPISLQHDVVYANAFAAVIDGNDLCENITPLALGCVGNRADKEFPLQSKTQVPLPLVMYPSETLGNTLEEVDMCGKPVLNWELYIKDLKRQRSSASIGNRYKSSEGDEPNMDVIDDQFESTNSGNRKSDKLCYWTWRKLKNRPKLTIEGTWNHLYGGYNGSCCFMKATALKKLYLFTAKGSQLRAIRLKDANPAAIFSYNVESIWDEDPTTPDYIALREQNEDPFNELIFQIVPNESSQLLGVRRGRSIQLYDTEDNVPVLIEKVPNILYGASEYSNAEIPRRMNFVQNPLIRGFDFNPTYSPEIISIDENKVIRVCNIFKRTTTDLFVLPNSKRCTFTPKGYPEFKLNDAIGASFANHGNVFYAWGDSVVYMGDRRSRKYSRSHIAPLFDLRNHVHSHAMSSQNYFHEAVSSLNEYMSCVRKSSKDPYYYVGTSLKIYLMDLRVPLHPVIAVDHGMQSPLTYIDVFNGNEENFETVVAGSQRLSETVCMISDLVHIECTQRQGCKGRNPLLYCYPQHLLNSRSYFDNVTKEACEFAFPNEYEQIKNHFYAWPTGLAVYPMNLKGDPKLPDAMIVATSNNYGDVFWQEWGQKPLPSHRKIDFSDYKLRSFVTEWRKAMEGKISNYTVQKASKNPKEPVDCTIFLEPIAKEIEKLSRVRDSPFDCFKPRQVQNHKSLAAMLPMDKLCDKLSKYKSPRVKAFLKVWCSDDSGAPESIDLGEEQIEVKIEPMDIQTAACSPTSTLEIESVDDLSQQLDEQKKKSAWNENFSQELHSQTDLEATFGDLMQGNQISQLQTEEYMDTNMFESYQFLSASDENKTFNPMNSSSFTPSLRKAEKYKRNKSGFL